MSSRLTDGWSRRAESAVDRLGAGKMQHRVKHHGGVAVGQHEAVAIWPDRIVGIEAKEALPQREDHRRKRHRRAGVTGIGLLHGIHRQGADGVDAKLIERALGRRWLPASAGSARRPATRWRGEGARRCGPNRRLRGRNSGCVGGVNQVDHAFSIASICPLARLDFEPRQSALHLPKGSRRARQCKRLHELLARGALPAPLSSPRA